MCIRDRYTTNPYVGQKKCRRIGDIVTPWSSFVIAARDEVIQNHPNALNKMCSVVAKKAAEVKTSARTAEIISWRYNIDLYQVKNWLSQTEWCNSPEDLKRQHEEVVSYLLNLGLISTNESNDWSKKLFL